MTNITTAFRYLTMLEYIPREPAFVTVKDVMAEVERQGFSIDRRSVERDLRKLAFMFKMVCDETERPHRWFFPHDVKPSMIPGMDDHAALSFLLMKSFLQPLLPPETLEMIEPWFRKAGERLASRKGNIAKWHEKIHVLPPGLPRQSPRISPEVQEEVYQAVLREFPLRLVHRPRDAKGPKEYLVSPLGLVVRDHLVYLIAALNESGRILQFALHRTQKTQTVEETYHRPQGFNLQIYVEENFGFPMGAPRLLELKLRLLKQGAISVSECPLASNQELVADGECFVLTADVPNTYELRQWIRSLGAGAEVIDPGFLRDEFAKEALALARAYGWPEVDQNFENAKMAG